VANAFPARENRARRWFMTGKARQFWFDPGDCRVHSRASFSFTQKIMQTSQGVERDMSQNSSRETRTQKVSFSMGFTSAHPEHESLKSCYVTSTSWNTPSLLSNELCEFCDRGWVPVLSRISRSWCVRASDRIERWAPGNIHDKNWPWKVHNVVRLVHFWNPHSICNGQRMAYDSQYFCQHVIPDNQQNICSSSGRKPWRVLPYILTMHPLTIRGFLQKRLNPQKPKECRIDLRAQPSPALARGGFSSLVTWRINSAIHLSLRPAIESLRSGRFSLKFRQWYWKICSQRGSRDDHGWARRAGNPTQKT
jgi:hypothetical protein